jgi:predicted O-methyltransferase YrrM
VSKFNNPVTMVRSVRSRLAADGPAVVREPGDFERISLPSLDADVLRDMLIGEGPRTVIEIGLAYGNSALAIAEALLSTATVGVRHLIIDAYQSVAFASAGWQQIQSAGVDGMCELIEEPSQYALPRLATAGFRVDAAFIDGSHIFHNVFVDLYFISQMIRPEGLVVLDDCEWPSVAIAVSYYKRYLGWAPQPVPRPTRLRAFRVPTSPPAIDFTSFMPPDSDGW